MKNNNFKSEYQENSISIISTGKLGSNLAIALQDSKYILKAVHSSRKNQRILLQKKLNPNILITSDMNEAIKDSKYIFITCTDDLIKKNVQKINSQINQVLIHFSASVTLSTLSICNNNMTGTIHPLQTFPNINCSDRLYKIPYAIESNHKEVVDWLYNFAKSFEGIPLKLSPEFRNIYHAAAVTSCALLSSLIAISSDMLDFLKLDDETRISMLIPIIYSTVEGISKEGIQRSMTGPYIRGDFDTIKSHLNALEDFDPKISLAYSSLALYTLEKTQINNPTHKSIYEKLLKSIKKNLEMLNK